MGLVLDRATSRVVLMASEEGGTEIEEVAEKTPEKIFKEEIDPVVGLMPYKHVVLLLILIFHII